MEEKNERTKSPSNAWMVNLIIGIVLAVLAGIWKYRDDLAGGRAMGDILSNVFGIFANIIIPFGVTTWILWVCRFKRLPSLALVVTVITGGLFFVFSLMESIGGFFTRPFDASAAYGGLMQIVVFTLPFFVIAWLLWIKPKIGAAVLILLGCAMGVWMRADWNLSNDEWVVPAFLVGLPIVLGLFTIIKESIFKSGNNSAAAC